jgi:2-dehydro-3-deoxyphosphogluconate aldolase/(4S)-4-hydroxy-2-oxoglutarate aldolase
MKPSIRDLLSCSPVMPVLVIDQIETAVPLARALCAGGIRVLEVTLRTKIGLQAIKEITDQVPEAIVGVGTVISPEQFALAQTAGARFAVSPGYTPLLGQAAHELNMPYLPGVFTPSEALTAMHQGYDTLKLYPAREAGGIAMLSAQAGPLPQLMFCPSGGVSAASAADYLALDNVICVSGSWLTPKPLLDAMDWDGIRQRALTAARLASHS